MLTMLCCCLVGRAQEAQSELQQKAETELKNGNTTSARFFFIRAYEDYVNKQKMRPGVECATRATALYYKENLYKEAFDLLRRVDQNIDLQKDAAGSAKATLHYFTSKERFQMYMKLHRPASAMDHLSAMANYAAQSPDDDVKNDLLYNRTLYLYTTGQTAKGNATFKEMADKLTASKEYDKVEEVYKTLIANGRRSNSAGLVAQSYDSYMLWKDSVNALKSADEIGALKKQIADNEATISDQDSSLTGRRIAIIALAILAAALAAALVVGAIVLLRFIMLTRKQKNTINMLNDNNALKAKFISNISAQLEPTLQKLDARIPEVKALQDFSAHIQTLSDLECHTGEAVELEDVQVTDFCEGLMQQIQGKVKSGVHVAVNAPKMNARINKEYVSHILLHLLNNAAEHTPESGNITLDFKKRGAHTHQFLVSDTGAGIPEELRGNVFKPFLEIRDLTQGDGLGLPICKQMALNMNGDLTIDSAFTKGTRFVLELHA